MNMKKYIVEYSERRWYELEVDAEDGDAAVEVADDKVFTESGLWHYSDEDTHVVEV